MCGIAGYIDFQAHATSSELTEIASAMASCLHHRGPDDCGVWVDGHNGVALSFRRLKIIDVSDGGHQPMLSRNERYVLVYNGEIYNYGDLRRELIAAGVSFRSTSDTEVLLEAIAYWGLKAALQRCNGMFAFALWDRSEKILHLARDRMGKKPLYYAKMGRYVIFASEIKALCAHPAFRKDIDRNALTLYLRYCYVPEPFAIFKNTFKLQPSELLAINGKQNNPSIKRDVYWDSANMVATALREPFVASETEAKTRLHDLLLDAVRLRMIADVPLGAFLSGGIDSSIVVALMQTLSDNPTKTFTIGFHEQGYNEAQNAAQVARHLGTEHTELYVTPKEAMAVIPQLPRLYDEPFADVSQIPTFLVSQLARQHVTVALSGDGGDELFAGYNRHRWVPLFWSRFGRLPAVIKRPILKLLTSVAPQRWDQYIKLLATVVPKLLKQPNPGDKLHKLARMLQCDCPEKMYFDLVSSWKEPQTVVLNADEPNLCEPHSIHFPDIIHKMMYFDMVRYLPGDILTKVDRASMGVSLEARAPLLDYRVVEFAWRLPLEAKIKNNHSKYLLKQVLQRYVPHKLIDRPKMGFGVPVGQWLRGSLRDWAENLLDPQRLNEEGFFDVAHIQQKWQEHLSGQRNWQYKMWNILMFQAWLDDFHKSAVL